MKPLRQAAYLRGRYRVIVAYAALISLLLGLFILSALAALLAWPQESDQAWAFLAPGLGLVAMGGGFWLALRPREPVPLTLPEGAVIVLLAWAVALVVGALPLMPTAGLNFSQAAFEAISGWTTTGLSVVDVAKASHLVLLYRSIMQLVGGAGLAIMMLAAFGGPLGAGLSAAEGRDRQLVPHIRRSTRLVVSIYLGYIVVGVAALRLAGMSWFDALNHSICAVSTGGFSTRVESLGYWNSALVETITMTLMVLGNLNFLTSYALLKGRWRAVARNGEVRLMAVVLPLAAVGLYFWSTAGMLAETGRAVRAAIFETVSALTTTGFNSIPYDRWNATAILILSILMLIGGGICSTAGGIKQLRVYVLYRAAVWEVRRLILPRSAVSQPELWQGEQRQAIDSEFLRQVAVFLALYLSIYGLGVLILTVDGYSLSDSVFEFASALGTVGLSVGVTSTSTPHSGLWAMTIAMFLGRLEIIIVMVG
ncbi:MAG: TrkH family potassium uptake protein, partial [Pseudomonadota bacterium]